MCNHTTTTTRETSDDSSSSETSVRPFSRVCWFIGFLFFDLICSTILLLPWVPRIPKFSGVIGNHYTLWGTLYDLALVAGLRALAALASLLFSYETAEVRPEFHFNLRHANGEKKSQEELEMEALEEPFWPWFKRLVRRPACTCEILCVVTQFLAVAKCLSRLDIEVGRYEDARPSHPMFWIAAAVSSLLSVVELSYVDSMSQLAAEYGKQCIENSRTTFFRRIGSSLSIPLLSEEHREEEQLANSEDPEQPYQNNDEVGGGAPVQEVGVSDITSDAKYKAGWSDLLYVCYPDIPYICVAFLFLLLAAVAQVYIPRFTGQILDSLTKTFSPDNNDDGSGRSIFDVPGFVSGVKKLVVASILCGLFSGIRGSIFTVVGGRVNVRLRVQLMDSLLSQDIGFFDTTKTGDITSRLSSDTTLVGDQVTLNVNVFLRSVVQAVGVLIFMFVVSWQLSIIAFISVPVVTALSKWYGHFLRSLTKLMQKKLADGNSVSEAAIGSMPTVRAFDASESELKEFESCMRQYLDLNFRASIAYLGYCTAVTSLPYLVIAIIIFYGGLLVRNQDMTSGELVSFILYLQSLSDAFSSIGYIFASLTQAVGAADKVFELMHRKPRYRVPSEDGVALDPSEVRGIIGITATKTAVHRRRGLRPVTNARGEIVLENVDLYYPARPQRRVLSGLSMKVPPGSVVALVGSSGGGKSSVMSLLQHLYEPSAGRVLLDGTEVHEYSPTWLSQNVSIVSQEPTLFGRSIKKNIIYGLEGTDREPSDEEVEEAARLSNASGFIETMPNGYDTEVGERGVQLSGGQKQRIAIARSLVRKPRVLLLDEATSALDSESEYLVQKAIDQMISRERSEHGHDGMTVMIVAHRLSTVRNADIIFVIKEGQVVEQGKHGDLLEDEDGYYASLIRRQMETKEKLDG